LLLVIEIDGRTHDYKIDEDKIRHDRLEELGITILRFTDHEVKSNPAGVSGSIRQWIDLHRSVVNEKKPTPNPSKEGR
jgi:very-short-patch-repair endonuclease